MLKIHFHYIPGVLGTESEWGSFLKKYPTHFWDPYTVLSPKDSTLEDWGQHFSSLTPEGINVFIGYSRGGRLLLHTLEHASLDSYYIFIATRLGWDIEEESKERKGRQLWEKMWAERFLKEEASLVVNAWHKQPLFEGVVKDLPASLPRENLFFDFLHWGLGQQKKRRATLEQHPHPVLWIQGERDLKEDLPALLHPLSERVILPECGHRLLWQAREILEKTIERWIERVTCSKSAH